MNITREYLLTQSVRAFAWMINTSLTGIRLLSGRTSEVGGESQAINTQAAGSKWDWVQRGMSVLTWIIGTWQALTNLFYLKKKKEESDIEEAKRCRLRLQERLEMALKALKDGVKPEQALSAATLSADLSTVHEAMQALLRVDDFLAKDKPDKACNEARRGIKLLEPFVGCSDS